MEFSIDYVWRESWVLDECEKLSKILYDGASNSDRHGRINKDGFVTAKNN